MHRTVPSVSHVIAAVALGLLVLGSSPGPTVFVFDRVNGHFRDLQPAVQDFQQGPLEVALDVHRASVAVERHRLTLQPIGGGRHRVQGEARFSGLADVTADVAAVGWGRQLDDRVIVPSQERSWQGVVRIHPRESGFEITVVEGPESLRVQMQSEVAEQALGTCRMAALLPGSGLACDALAAFFRNVPVRLFEPGETYWLERAQLTAEEQRQVDAYLAAAAG